MKQIKNIQVEDIGFHEGLQKELSTYPEKTVHEDGTVTIEQVMNPYFLVNNSWNISNVGNINQFKKMLESYKGSTKNIRFQFNSPTINLEVKYVWYNKLFNDEWTLGSVFGGQIAYLRELTRFLNEKYPTLPSILDLDIEKAEKEWLFWLHEQKIQTQRIKQGEMYKEYTCKTTIANFLQVIHSNLSSLTDSREEWVKDRWDVRILNEKYGIDYNKSRSEYYLDFTKIEHLNTREQVKRYFKKRILSMNKFSWSTALNYMVFLPNFISYIFLLEPNWNDFKKLKRSHMEQYIQWLHEYARNNLKQKNANPPEYVARALKVIGKFLEDIQRYEYDLAPETNVRLLLFPEDKPKSRKKTVDQIEYIPDYVLEQLFTHIDNLHEDVIPVVWIAFKTGLRISDVLGLTSDCLVKLNGQYSIETDIEKTYVKDHRIPIDDQLANILAILIQKSKEHSNQDNNPEGFIFIRYRGVRKGKPFSQRWINKALNSLIKQNHIVDESGKLFHFNAHQFRHTYAVKMLNGGADILTVQELLAHASPEMTLRYAKLLDDTKRKAFESVINQGVFTFDLNGEVQEIKAGEDIPTDILDALWQDHKLNAMDNPYGTCHARLNGNCPHMEAPPCLTCGDNQTPCKDLAVGFSELDKQKYELHVKTTTKAIEIAKQRGREDIAEKNEKNLQRYQNILNTLQEGNIIFGRQARMKRKLGVKNV
ncbi:tyrosine-type recombinase/integrase [Bacillus benzoevorans]|uniref:Integrase n=1 Tax=Bacillus benzoevorans TaxID=1456 RepID=A0A7X0HXX2_9BACI|nr:tyrosine-type recombinase/integrase [Bacillus benzoevorans]MBB6448022.1 integrase [Bacillus benzoevorans]